MNEKAFNAADPEQVAGRKRTEKQQREQQQADLKALLTQPEFRRFLWRHMNETCGMMKSAANPNGSQQSLYLGMQSVALALFAEVESVDPFAIPKMMIEYAEANKA